MGEKKGKKKGGGRKGVGGENGFKEPSLMDSCSRGALLIQRASNLNRQNYRVAVTLTESLVKMGILDLTWPISLNAEINTLRLSRPLWR